MHKAIDCQYRSCFALPMPAPLAEVNKDAVEAHVITHGVADAARAFDLPLNTVKAWSARGKWLQPARATVVQPLPKSMQGRATGAATGATAARISKENLSVRSRLNAARTVDKGFSASARMKGEHIIAVADKLKSLGSLGQIAHEDWRDQQGKASVNLSFTMHCGAAEPERVIELDRPVVEQEGTVLPLE